MGRTNIEWCDFTWSPIIGCENKCGDYCYAETLHERRRTALLEGKQVPECYKNPFNVPTFFSERLEEPFKMKMPKERNEIAKLISPDKPVVFVISMGDIFSNSVKNEWISEIIRVCASNPDKIFMFLTKRPERYLYFKFPQNCWLGTTCENRIHHRRVGIIKLMDNKRFVSIEPLLSTMENVDFSNIDFVIMGGMSGDKNYEAKREWIESVKHNIIYHKKNIKKYILKYQNEITEQKIILP